jgi:hypothetical protein
MALPQMLKINERLDKLAAARADFTARGMLAESCLIQAIRVFSATTGDSDDPMDEDAGDSDQTNSLSSDEIYILDPDPNHPNTHTLEDVGTAHTLDDTDMRILNNASTHILGDTGTRHVPDDTDADTLNNTNTHILGINNNHPHLHDQGSPTLFDDEEDDHGPVESGPLMNEVRLAYKRG